MCPTLNYKVIYRFDMVIFHGCKSYIRVTILAKAITFWAYLQRSSNATLSNTGMMAFYIFSVFFFARPRF